MPEKPKLVAQQLPDYEPEIGAALWRLQDARRRTLRLLRDVPADIVEQETEGDSVGTILYHVALIEADWLYAEILEQPIPDNLKSLMPEEDRDEGGVLTSIRDRSLEEHINLLSTIRETFLQMLRSMSREDFHRTRSLPDYDVSPAWVLHHLAQHEAEHRSELESVMSQLKTQNPNHLPERG